jgi:hypothetical protein
LHYWTVRGIVKKLSPREVETNQAKLETGNIVTDYLLYCLMPPGA